MPSLRDLSIDMVPQMVRHPLLVLAGSVILIGAGTMVLARFLPKRKLFGTLILDRAQKQDEGFVAHKSSEFEPGMEGIALTRLRPGGTGLFNGQRLDIASYGSFIEANSKIKIVKIEGTNIIVDSLDN